LQKNKDMPKFKPSTGYKGSGFKMAYNKDGFPFKHKVGGVLHNERLPNPGNPEGELNPSHEHTKGEDSKLGTGKKGGASN
jgi:hypothetical protein